jgi:hypothetical protein
MLEMLYLMKAESDVLMSLSSLSQRADVSAADSDSEANATNGNCRARRSNTRHCRHSFLAFSARKVNAWKVCSPYQRISMTRFDLSYHRERQLCKRKAHSIARNGIEGIE